MNFDDSPREAEFRAEARKWIAENGPRYLPPPGADFAALCQLARAWQAAKADAGYAGFGIPKELGGRGGEYIDEAIFADEEKGHPLHEVNIFVLGSHQIVTVLGKHATPELCERLSRPTLRGDLVWCQLYSEPSAGSDMAAIGTRATRDGDNWIINGQKVWTSFAHIADWGLLLTRTDPDVPKHKGLTVFVVDMKTPGIDVRPLRQMSGRSEFSEVFFSDVRIPDSCRIGEVGGGWAVSLTTLLTERLALSSDPTTSLNLFDNLMRLAMQKLPGEERRFIDDQLVRYRLAEYYVRHVSMRYFQARMLTSLSKGQVSGPEATIGKLMFSRWLQEISAFAMDMLGPAGLFSDDSGSKDLRIVHESYFLAPGYRMGGGTEEIGKNIIAEQVLRLPPDIRVDKTPPFRELRK
jgi:alkylation response protein AidB-like acyl-CoA dehydrogenase